jgi:hypothetical protein
MKLQTLGLLRERFFSDIPAPGTALDNLLTSLIGGKTYLSEDLTFLRDVAQISQSPVDDTYDEVVLTLDTELQKLRGILPTEEDFSYIKPIRTIKNRFDEFNLTTGIPRFQGGNGLTRRTYSWYSVYPSTSSLPEMFDSSVFTNITPVFTDTFWGRGNISFASGVMSPALTGLGGIQVFSGFFRPTQSGIHRFNILSTTTGGVVVELANDESVNMLTSTTYFVPTSSSQGNDLSIATQPLEKFRFYNIRIYFLRSPENVESDPTHNASLKLVQPISTSSVNFYYDFLYDENYLSNISGELIDFYDNKLPMGGTNFHTHDENQVESFAIGGKSFSDYKEVLTTKRLIISYTPPKLYSTVVATKTGALIQGTNYITGIANTADIRVGDLILNGSKDLPDFTYVKEVVNSTTVFTTKNILVSHSTDTLFFIDHRGLKGYTQNYNIFTTPTHYLTPSAYKGEAYKPKDVILHKDINDTNVYTTISAISSDGSIFISSSFLQTPSNNEPVLLYYRGGIRNLALSSYCTSDNNLQLVSANTTLYADANTDILTIDSDNIIDYDGNKIDINILATTNSSLSAYKVNYSTAIPDDTYITAIYDTNKITLSKLLIEPISDQSTLIISLSTPTMPVSGAPKYECFVPTVAAAPFFTVSAGIETPPMSSIDISNRTLTVEAILYEDNASTSRIKTTPLQPRLNALIPIKDRDGLTLFLIASAIPES